MKKQFIILLSILFSCFCSANEPKSVDCERCGRYESGFTGNPIVLTISESKNEEDIDFTYHTDWNNKDISGTAYWAGRGANFTYTQGKYKILISFDMQENTVVVQEFENNVFLLSKVLLWKLKN